MSLEKPHITLPCKNTTIKIKQKFTFLDLFSGIGGFRIPLEELGGLCLGYSEIDKQSLLVYQNNFINSRNQEEINLGDIRNIAKLPFTVDILVGGVPCQSWSVAGKLQGFNDERGELWFDAIRLVRENQPKAFIFENVKGLTSPIHQNSFQYLIQAFTQIGYYVKSHNLNSYDFGLPQNRERIFIVGIRNDIENHNYFSFPEPLPKKTKLYDVIDGILDKKQPIDKVKFPANVLFGDKIPVCRNRFQKQDELNDFFVFCDTRNGHTTIHSWDLIKTTPAERLICMTILKNRRKKIYGPKDGNPLSFTELQDLIPQLNQKDIDSLITKKILRYVNNPKIGYEFVNSKNSSGINGIYRIFLPHADAFPTLTATVSKDFVAKASVVATHPDEYKQLFIKIIYHQRKYKEISGEDAKRLQGFPDNFIIHSNEKIAKKQFGNAVSVPVVYHLAKSVLQVIKIY